MITEGDLVVGREYLAELGDCCIEGQVSLGAFRGTSGEGWLYFDNGSFCTTSAVEFYDAEQARNEAEQWRLSVSEAWLGDLNT